mmetsp:Transcript_44498/g.96809  ORF Transcript_44498/g.96809 Transcript_44498/m.96809 type:complete len:172 (+) Transcript_44498:80-595(+)|eukprot:CAMPEP_0170612328 /NCGR_PEP_ID=MMETSP0224-20130122/23665_1 /TAXON_ID=285029 /ORGANISM="Togula jolla, Strain CCCM 725" /LENGTH=171 /DNA_ID=CAMNT_0010937825 /DNA_START=80 /DNA_END=595 /DNA_ORIENTATION=-
MTAMSRVLGGVRPRLFAAASLHAARAGRPSFTPGGRMLATKAARPSDLSEEVSQQRRVLFPTLDQLEEAQKQRDVEARRRADAVESKDWSPRQLPYKTFERSGPADDTDDDEEDEGNEVEGASNRKERATQAADSAVESEFEAAEELGFRYKGPEPTQFGDWAHKGRVTDF